MKTDFCRGLAKGLSSGTALLDDVWKIGSGKTVLCSRVIDYISPVCHSKPESEYAFSLPDAIDHAIVWKHLSFSNSLFKGTSSLPKWSHNSGRVRTTLAALRDLLIVYLTKTFIIIDGLGDIWEAT